MEVNGDFARRMLPWVRGIAREMAARMPPGVEVDDLTQDGMIGLMSVARRFEESRGLKFETFAKRRVKGAMIDALRKQSWPRSMRRVRREIVAATEALQRELGRQPKKEEVAGALGISVDFLEQRLKRIEQIESTAKTEEGLTVGVFLGEGFIPKESVSPLRSLIEAEEHERLRAAIKMLSPKDRRITTLYYFRGLTQKQIGEMIGIGESRVCQILTKIIHRLRTILEDPPAKAAVAA